MPVPFWLSLSLPPWLRRRFNPHNLSRLHLAKLAEKHGFAIGDYSYGAPKVRFAGMGSTLTIGKYCSIADKVEVFLGGNHRTDFVTTYPFTAIEGNFWPEAAGLTGFAASRGDVVIGHDVWIGSGAAILSGVTIGNGAVIAARAVITKDVAPYAIVAGNPARHIRFRFFPETIEQLQEVAWWDLPEASVRKLIRILQSERIEAAVEAVRTERARLAFGETSSITSP